MMISTASATVNQRVFGFPVMMMMICLLLAMATPSTTNALMQPRPSSSSTTCYPKLSSSFHQQISYPQYHSKLQLQQQQQSVTNEPVKEVYDYEIPEDAVIHIKPAAMRRLRELRDQQSRQNEKNGNDDYLILRMGVRSGGCSGMSYVMDFCTQDSINMEDDQIDVYETDRIQCVVDSKSMLYLYGLQLDYSTQLIGGGFKFYNPNAEESCGCGSSFGV